MTQNLNANPDDLTREPFYLPPRDFVGYGLDSPRDCWPGGKKIAVSFVLNYEEGAEQTLWNGDKISCNNLHELHYERPQFEGKRDALGESLYEYGIRCGVPRLLKLFKEFNYRWTTWACARAFEVTGEYPRMIAEAGHEVACHGNRWRDHGLNSEQERAHINQSFDRLQKATGLKDVPTGYYLGNGSIRQKLVRAEVHKQRGVPLLYSSDCYGSDVPYYIPSPLAKVHGDKDEGMLMIPYSLCTNDHRFMTAGGAGISDPDDWFELLQGQFDVLYAEGQAGKPKMMTIAMHNRMLGKPGRIMGLRRFMEYIRDKPDVWVCTRSEIARHWREKYPYEVVGPAYKLHNDLDELE